jgi:putative nucleotidyltransferase with HDIG domain
MKLDDTRQLVQALAAASKGLRLYALDHPATTRQVHNLQDDLCRVLGHGKTVKLGVLEGTLFVADHLFTQDFPAALEISRLLEAHQLAGIEFHAGVAIEELQALLALLHTGNARGPAFGKALKERHVEHIRVVASEEEEDGSQPRKVYQKALKVVDQIFNDVRMGEIPSSADALQVVRNMAQLTITEPHAMLALSLLKDYDNYTFTHSVNVSVLALAVGRACDADEEQLRILGLGGLLHDLGKLKVDVYIINKPGRLTDAEFEAIKEHPRFGADITVKMAGVDPEAVEIVHGHHVRYDRYGYPADAADPPVSPLVDMTAIADAYDAMTTLRAYQRPVTPRKAIARLREAAGTGLHPDYVERFTASLGPYPVGSLVRLDSNEIGLVVEVNPAEPSIADLKILFAASGARVDEPYPLQLNPAQPRRIVAEVDPYSKGIEVSGFFN